MQDYKTICYVLSLSILIISTITDLKKRTIPNLITLPFIPIGLIINGLNNENIIPIIITIIILFIISFLRIFGFGDIKLFMAVCSLSGLGIMLFMIGFGAIATFAYYYIINPYRIKKATAEGINSILSFDKDKIKNTLISGDKIPFAPFLLIGFVISVILIIF